MSEKDDEVRSGYSSLGAPGQEMSITGSVPEELAHALATNRVCGECVAGDQLVLVDGRALPIAYAAKARTTLDARGNWTPIATWTHSGVKELLEIRTTRGGVLRVTPNHRLWTARGWIEAAELRSTGRDGHRLADTVETLLAPSIDRPGRDLSAADALLLGALVGDGWQEPDGLGFIVNQDVIDAWTPVLRHAGELFGSREKLHAARDSHTSRVLWRNAGARAFRDRWLNKDHVPAELWTHPIPVVGAYLRGLFSTDGGVNQRQVTFSQVTKTLVDEVRLLLRMIGISSTVSVSERDPSLPRGIVKPGSRQPIYTVAIGSTVSVQRFLDVVGFVEPRKQRALEDLARDREGRDVPERIKSVTPAGEGQTFDLMVPDTSQFWASGMLVHNCKYFELAEGQRLMRAQQFIERLVREQDWQVKYLASPLNDIGICGAHSSGRAGAEETITGRMHMACDQYRPSKGLVTLTRKTTDR